MRYLMHLRLDEFIRPIIREEISATFKPKLHESANDEPLLKILEMARLFKVSNVSIRDQEILPCHWICRRQFFKRSEALNAIKYNFRLMKKANNGK